MAEQLDIKHNSKTNRFETDVDGATAYVEYEVADDGVMVFTHTIVPEELEGRGIARELVTFALDYARKNEKKVFAECAYVDAFLEKHHKDYADIIDES